MRRGRPHRPDYIEGRTHAGPDPRELEHQDRLDPGGDRGPRDASRVAALRPVRRRDRTTIPEIEAEDHSPGTHGGHDPGQLAGPAERFQACHDLRDVAREQPLGIGRRVDGSVRQEPRAEALRRIGQPRQQVELRRSAHQGIQVGHVAAAGTEGEPERARQHERIALGPGGERRMHHPVP